jgi:hypothetical protein
MDQGQVITIVGGLANEPVRPTGAQAFIVAAGCGEVRSFRRPENHSS